MTPFCYSFAFVVFYQAITQQQLILQMQLQGYNIVRGITIPLIIIPNLSFLLNDILYIYKLTPKPIKITTLIQSSIFTEIS